MPKRKRKPSTDGEASPEETAADQNGSIGTSGGLMASMRQGESKLHQLELVCKNFKRHLPITPDKMEKFVTRVFEVAGVELS